jgi:AAA+ superfamily predicted ATPase
MQGEFPEQLGISIIGMARRINFFHLNRRLKEAQQNKSEEEYKLQEEREKFCKENSDIIENGSYKWQKLENNRILFYGPHGNGKTTVARKFAEKIGADLIEISGSEILTMYAAGGVNNVRKIFEDIKTKLEECKTVVLFIDEIDVVVSESKTEMRSEQAAATKQLLKRLDLIQSNPRVVFICATNHFEKLDGAFKSRMSYKIEFNNPSNDVRLQIMEYYFKSKDIDLGDIPWSSWWVTPFYCGKYIEKDLRRRDLLDKLLKKTENLSSRDLEIFINNVSDYLKCNLQIDESTLMGLVPTIYKSEDNTLDYVERISRIISNATGSIASCILIWERVPDDVKSQVVQKILDILKGLIL